MMNRLQGLPGICFHIDSGVFHQKVVRETCEFPGDVQVSRSAGQVDHLQQIYYSEIRPADGQGKNQKYGSPYDDGGECVMDVRLFSEIIPFTSRIGIHQ